MGAGAHGGPRPRHHSATDAELAAGNYVDDVRVDGFLAARLNDYVNSAAVTDVRVPLRGVQLRRGAWIEVVAGKDTKTPNREDFEIENVRLEPFCR